MKICTVCMENKDESNFLLQSSRFGKPHYRSPCKKCIDARKHITEKLCTKCDTIKPLKEFYKTGATQEGRYRSKCISCHDTEKKRSLQSYEERLELKKKGLKLCHKCFKIKEIHLFQMDYGKRVPTSPCKECRKMAEKLRYKYVWKRLEVYNLTKQQFDDLIIYSNGKCNVCNIQLIGDSWGHPATVNIDHDHKTGKVRGLLCRNCNQGIGHLKDNPDFLKNAAEYLLNPWPNAPDPLTPMLD